MKISLITCTYNSAPTLPDTIASVRSQTFGDLEYIVVDGASSDHTMDVVEQHRDVITRCISEPDQGIYDAMNKGIEMSTGEVIGFLHSDDFFNDPEVLATIERTFRESGSDAVYGDLLYVDRLHTSKVIRNWKSKPFRKELFHAGWMPAHPTFYLRAEHYRRYGLYNTSFRISADYELMLRMLLKHGLSARYIPETLVRMRVGGESNASLANRWKANREDARAWKVNDLRPKLLTRWKKPLSKLSQFFG